MLPFVSRKKYEEVAYKLECLLCHATGGRLSKHNYPLRTMEKEVTDYIEECCEEAVEEATAAKAWERANVGEE